ncbi:carboxyl transferase domain-containing protein [Eubacterium sp.]|uniref:acyl-CoA carboxylase subunit beta n=1 Tax=Eubacterium sp. TaxID=142586 RepID=UPI00258D637A|nr:carboxyl transferase domain-containing protein [Eubacterium sp.]MCR5367600.1 carboxyl transferase [Eubacterium sp.]
MSNQGLSASERIACLLDDSSFVEVGAYVEARSTDFNIPNCETPKDGVITGYGLIGNKLVYVYSQDASVLGGAVGEMHAKKISNIYNMAMKVGAPVIGLIDSAGIRLQEATDALNAFSRLYLKQTMASGVIPQVTAIFGNCGGGAAIIPALSDFTYMTKNNSKLFVNSPNALADNYTEKLDTAGAAYLSENTSLVDNAFDTEEEVLGEIRNLISIIPSNNVETAINENDDDLNRIIPNLDGFADDARAVLQNISDNSLFVEIKKDFAKDMVVGFISLGGATVGCVANQVKDGGKALTTNGAKKAAKFVNFCDSFNIPVLSLTNVEGYASTVEEAGTIAPAAAELSYAFANATVPKVNLVIGNAFGSAYTVMNSKALGADIVYAWPNAKIGMMDAEMAVKIMYASELEAATDKQAFISEKIAEYNNVQSSALAAAKRGYVDDIIEPDATRKRIIASLIMLATKDEQRPFKKHSSL